MYMYGVSFWVPVIGAGAGAVTLLTGIICVFYKLGKWDERMETVKGLKSDMSSIKDSIADLNANVKIIFNHLKIGTERSDSPTKLTEVGEEIAESIHAREIIDENFKLLKPRFECIETRFDIELEAREISREIYAQLNTGTQNKIKEELYDRGLPLAQVYPIFALLLRDKIFKDREDSKGTS